MVHRGPSEALSLGTPHKQRGWRYQNAARRLSARIGPGRPSGQLAGGCVPVPGSHAALLSVDICCMWKNCVEFVCILILHLCSLSLAERTGSSACLACINCPCLARCLLLIILINFNSPGSHCHSSCYFFYFFFYFLIQPHMQLHRRIPTCILGQAWMHISMSTTLHLFYGVK